MMGAASAAKPLAWMLRLLCLSSLLSSAVLCTAATAADCPVSLDDEPPFEHSGQATENTDWLSLYLACLPPLTHDRGERHPLVLWSGVGDQPLSPEQIRGLLDRGLVQHLPLRADAISAAKALQQAGAPVVLMDGKVGGWPYNLLDDKSWQLPIDDPQRFSHVTRVQADPTRLDAWQLAARQIRGNLSAFREAGIDVDAVWLDYEGLPMLSDYRTVKQSLDRLHASIPAAAMVDEAAFMRYRRQLWLNLISAYVAAPIHEVYPNASSTNWVTALSSQQVPVLSWYNWHHPQVLTLFTATNPVAYGIDTAYRAVQGDLQASDQAAIDRLYLHVLLRQVSADAWNRHQYAPHLHSVPWVARWVKDEAGQTPQMSRRLYREALRHLWLRDVDGMQVFNPARRGRAALQALAEAQDVQHVYDQMLALGSLLENGEVMNYQVPMPGESGLLWSGLRDDRQAVVRLIRLGGPHAWLKLEAWPGEQALLPASEEGATFRLQRSEAGVVVRTLQSGAE